MRNLCIEMECEIAALTKELAEARQYEKQRDALAEALESLMYGHEVKDEWEKCEQALAAVKGGAA